eukprot:TRINITY_DN65896_c17_g1_i1.p1 TRINITY_DN65896_c17_g1~~TRINITY_DN65896_c17_g1_i1.p1  ORF type:complete len:327 (-),score=111.39 TRINITY_DN65896_c17_g1_i1:45-1025(-)
MIRRWHGLVTSTAAAAGFSRLAAMQMTRNVSLAHGRRRTMKRRYSAMLSSSAAALWAVQDESHAAASRQHQHHRPGSKSQIASARVAVAAARRVGRVHRLADQCRSYFTAMGIVKPKRIILIRHGESEGNVDPKIYESMPDNRLRLTRRGQTQAREAGKKLKAMIGDERVMFYVSPYVRTRQTFAMMVRSLAPDQYIFREEPRLREQDFGNFQKVEEIEECRRDRDKFGSFYYRFPQGESGCDVYDRVSTFMETLHREFQNKDRPDNFVLVSHGVTCRLFLMRYFNWDVERFQNLWNLEHCQMVTMLLGKDGYYRLTAPLRTDTRF